MRLKCNASPLIKALAEGGQQQETAAVERLVGRLGMEWVILSDIVGVSALIRGDASHFRRIV
eukprot:260284-Pelagomonas_calceolata.AAC.1